MFRDHSWQDSGPHGVLSVESGSGHLPAHCIVTPNSGSKIFLNEGINFKEMREGGERETRGRGRGRRRERERFVPAAPVLFFLSGSCVILSSPLV